MSRMESSAMNIDGRLRRPDPEQCRRSAQRRARQARAGEMASRLSSTGGTTWGRKASRSRWSICAPRSASIRKAGPSSTTCGCRNTAGASCWRRRSRAAKFRSARHKGEHAWQEVPGEYRAMLRRLIVIQGDTEPASVEQQRHLGKTAPSLYDMRNLFQVNVEEGRHLWAMVYLLHKYFGTDGRDEAEALLQRRSGDADTPRMLGAFNEATPDWLSFFMFTYLHRPRRQDAARGAGAVRLRSAVAHLPLHADRRGAPHVRRRDRRRPHRRSAPARR